MTVDIPDILSSGQSENTNQSNNLSCGCQSKIGSIDRNAIFIDPGGTFDCRIGGFGFWLMRKPLDLIGTSVYGPLGAVRVSVEKPLESQIFHALFS